MTVSDILTIVSYVACTQITAEILAKKLVYEKEPYKESVASFERAKQRHDKLAETIAINNANANNTNNETKQMKKLKIAQDLYHEAAANVAKKHTVPGLLTSVVFLILYRILNLEYSGKVVAVLPFQPWSIVQRFFSARGLNFVSGFVLEEAFSSIASARVLTTIGFAGREISNQSQACSFLFIYILTNLSVKFMISKIVGVQPPKGKSSLFSKF